jgi:hypothetical protein
MSPQTPSGFSTTTLAKLKKSDKKQELLSI